MIVAVDFDGTIVSQERAYDDLETPLVFLPGARQALLRMKKAGHLLILFSARANLALRVDPMLDPMVRSGVRKVDRDQWEARKPLHEARYQEMLKFIEEKLPGVFVFVDDGRQGKVRADLFIDDRNIAFNDGWRGVVQTLGL